jgi:hypothetical protein
MAKFLYAEYLKTSRGHDRKSIYRELCSRIQNYEMYGLNIDKDNLMWGFLIVKKSKTNLD